MRNAIEPIIRRAARLMLDFADPAVYSKGRHADFVTEADVAVQEFLIDELAKAFPAACFLAEEGEGQTLTDKFTFIIDPHRRHDELLPPPPLFDDFHRCGGGEETGVWHDL